MFGPKEAEAMRELQAALAVVLRRANENKVPAHVAAYALTRLSRQLLDFMPAAARQAHCDTICAYLNHATPVEEKSLITLH